MARTLIKTITPPRIAILSDVKPSGTAGGTFTSGSYQTRTLNTLVDPTGIVTSLSSNRFTLSAGEYYIEASAPAVYVDGHKVKIRNITDSTDALIGTAEETGTNAGAGTQMVANRSSVAGFITLGSAKTFELQHRAQSTRITNGFGDATSFGDNEVYTIVKITKIA